MSAGMPKCANHWDTNAWAQTTVVVSFRGIASGHREKRSTIVRRWVNPLEGGRGPTRSTCMWSKRRFGMSNCSSGALMCVWILELWQGMHARTQFPTCFLSPFLTNLELMNFLVIRIEWRDRRCIRSKTWCHYETGTTSLVCPVDVSQRSVTRCSPKGMSCYTNTEGVVRYDCTSWSTVWETAMQNNLFLEELSQRQLLTGNQPHIFLCLGCVEYLLWIQICKKCDVAADLTMCLNI